MQKVSEVLQKEGYLAIIGGNILTIGDRDWQKILKKILMKWRNTEINNNSINYREQFPNALKEFGFRDVFQWNLKKKSN